MGALQEKLSSLANFENAINSPSTKEEYFRSLNNFFNFFNVSDPDDYVSLDPDLIHDNLATYISHEKSKGIKNHSIKGKINAVFLFLEMNRVLLHKKILRKMLPEDNAELGGGVPFSNDDIVRMLAGTDKVRTKAVIHFVASTGCRPGAIADPILRMKHLIDMPNGCKAIKIYDGSKDGYWSFLTPEAAKSLKNYHSSRKINGESFNDESPIFANILDGRGSKGKGISPRSVREMIYRILEKTGIEREKVGKRYDKAVIYGFRKRFNTILKINNDVNSNIAEKLMAHKRGLDGTYLKPTRDECFNEFNKSISDLTINDKERILEEKKIIEKEKSELQQINEKLKQIQKENEKLERQKNRAVESIDMTEEEKELIKKLMKKIQK